MRTIAHIVNPVIVPPSSDLFVAQPITFETMKRARDFVQDQVEVSFFSAQYPEDRKLVPPDFELTPDLDRSILDLGTFQKKWKLPFLADILDRLYEASSAEFFIYSNVDIALMPNFYVTVNQFIEQGYDGFVINRRAISTQFQSVAEIPLMYAEVGKPHPGHDCFVFRRDTYPKYKFGNICIGVSWIGRVFIWNVAGYAQKFREFKHLHLTFHIGDEEVPLGRRFPDFLRHNRNEAALIFKEIEKELGPFPESHVLYDYLPWIFLKDKSDRIPNPVRFINRVQRFLKEKAAV